MDFAAINAYPFGATPDPHLPLYQKRAVYFNTRRLRECYKELVELDAAEETPDETESGKKRLLLIVSIHCLLGANKFAFGFNPGATERLMVDTGYIIDDMRAKIRALAEEIETITLSSDDDDDEPDMGDVAEEDHVDS